MTDALPPSPHKLMEQAQVRGDQIAYRWPEGDNWHSATWSTYLEEVETCGRSMIAAGVQPGDVVSTASDTNALARWVGFNPSTPLTFGVEKFVHWYADFYSS